VTLILIALLLVVFILALVLDRWLVKRQMRWLRERTLRK
jgi:hypothetical protein